MCPQHTVSLMGKAVSFLGKTILYISIPVPWYCRWKKGTMKVRKLLREQSCATVHLTRIPKCWRCPSCRWNNHPVNLVSVFTGLYQVSKSLRDPSNCLPSPSCTVRPVLKRRDWGKGRMYVLLRCICIFIAFSFSQPQVQYFFSIYPNSSLGFRTVRPYRRENIQPYTSCEN